MVTFSIFLTYDGEDALRPIAEGCNKKQVLNILSDHLMLAEVAHFKIIPFEHYVPFKEYTL